MQNSDREEIQKRLVQLPVPLQVAFAVRIVIMALPCLLNRETGLIDFFRQVHGGQGLLSILRTLPATFIGASREVVGEYYLACMDATAEAARIASLHPRSASDGIRRIIGSDLSAGVIPSADKHRFFLSLPYYDDVEALAQAAFATVTATFDVTASSGVRGFAAMLATREFQDLDLTKSALAELVNLDESCEVSEYLQRPLSLRTANAKPISDSDVVDMDSTDAIGFEILYHRFLDILRTYGDAFDWWADWLQDRLEGKSIDWGLLEKTALLDQSLLEQGPAAVNAYLKSLTAGDAQFPLNRVRAIFIGYGFAGKTSLIRALHGEEIIEGQEAMTPGVAIREWPLPDSDIMANLWDFGGQVMAHATHKFFLREKCVYVLVLDGRSEISANQQAEYWLEHVRAFGGDAPVVLVGNKVELAAVNLDMNDLKARYQNIVEYCPLSCLHYRDSHQKQFEIFQEVLAGQLGAIGTHQIQLTVAHFRVFEQLQIFSRQDAILSAEHYRQLCDEQGIERSGGLDQDWLLDLLDKLGQVVYFPNIPTLDGYVLNPCWLTYGVYSVLYSDLAKGSGRVMKKAVVEILKNAKLADEQGHILNYPADKAGFILEAMEQFEICYRLPNTTDSYILPDLLPSDRPEDLAFDKTQALVFDFDFEGMLPRHLMTVFIVRCHGEIVEGLVWQNGVRLKSDSYQAEALVQADYHRRRLSIWLDGADAARYFSVLYDEFKSLLKPMPKLRYQEWVGLPVYGSLRDGEDAPRADYLDLLALERDGECYYRGKHGKFFLSEVLKIMPKEQREQQAREIHFHVGGNMLYNETGEMRDVTLGDKTVYIDQAKQLSKELGAIEYLLEVEVEDETLRKQALRELEMIRKALADLQQAEPEQRKTALDRLERFADNAKEGGTKTIEALKLIKDGGESIGWLMEIAPAAIALLANLV